MKKEGGKMLDVRKLKERLKSLREDKKNSSPVGIEKTDSIGRSVEKFFEFIGEDKDREGLKDTPDRVIRACGKLFGGYNQLASDILKTTFIDGTCSEMVMLKDVEFYSTCEHHLLPFFGKVHIAYIPNKKVVGISKLARLVEVVFARRLQIQERLSSQIAEAISENLNPLGVMVVVEAQHFCMTARGVEKQNSKMVTSAIRGAFEKSEARSEFFSLLK